MRTINVAKTTTQTSSLIQISSVSRSQRHYETAHEETSIVANRNPYSDQSSVSSAIVENVNRAMDSWHALYGSLDHFRLAIEVEPIELKYDSETSDGE